MSTATAVNIAAPEQEALSEGEQRAWRGLLRAHARLAKRLDAQLEAAHHLPMTSYEVLSCLHQASGGRMRMRDLADQAQLSRSGLTRLVDRLERDGLLERCSCTHDARGAYACLTDPGRERLEEARLTHLAVVREQFFSHFSELELGLLADMWERIAPCGKGQAQGNGAAHAEDQAQGNGAVQAEGQAQANGTVQANGHSHRNGC